MAATRRQRGLFSVPVNIYLMLVVVAAAALLHATWLPLAPLGIRPDLMLVVVVAWSGLRGLEEGLLWGFLGGALLDLLSAGPFGAFSLAAVVAALLAGSVHRAVFGAGPLLPAATITAATFLYHVVYLLVLALTGYQVDWATASQVMLPALVWNVALLLVLAPPLGWLHRRTGAARLEV